MTDSKGEPLVEVDVEGFDSEEEKPSVSQATPECYCRETVKGTTTTLECEECKRNVHSSCLKSGLPTSLEGDIFFKLICEECSPQKKEEVTRLKITWQQVVILSLYNLSLRSSGRKGFFRWREDLCDFIEKNWTNFFGERHRSATWYGTVASVLSLGNKQIFKSGVVEFGEPGWWALVENRPPKKPDNMAVESQKSSGGPRGAKVVLDPTITVEGLRTRKRTTSLVSAMELKEKRSKTNLSKSGQEQKSAETSATIFETVGEEMPKQEVSTPSVPLSRSPSVLSLLGNAEDSSSEYSFISSLVSETEFMSEVLPTVAQQQSELGKEDDGRPSDTRDSAFTAAGTSQGKARKNEAAAAVSRAKRGQEPGKDSSQSESSEDEFQEKRAERKWAKKTLKKPSKQKTEVDNHHLRFYPMTVYEEKQLLKHLNRHCDGVTALAEAKRLRRKLIVREEKRARGLQLFDIDQYVINRERTESSQDSLHEFTDLPKFSRVLDRFQITHHPGRTVRQQQYPSFRACLIGCNESSMMQSTISPYTARVLKPFIRRDYESKPRKLRLLQEVLEHRKHKDSSFELPPPSPVDYCYIRPQHIATVNAICREFFWPGIDVSEALQYPDFSVVALYKKIVIGFGFMVPDVKYNEAYISFLFVHPEWRKAGIATFMVYHLIQTCMGKDVTLHVSATNSALLLYQKFGFKPEEFNVDFYDKYYPIDSKECKHAFFLRLRR